MQLAFGVVGAFIGAYFGAPMVGFAIGSAIGGALYGPKGQDGPRMTDLHLQNSVYGGMIPITFGTMRIAGMVDWKTDLKETGHSSGGKGGSGGSTNYTYSVSCGIRFNDCDLNGPIIDFKRIWADGRLIYDVTNTDPNLKPLPMVKYLGGQDQMPDPTMVTVLGVGNVPAYRGVARLVFTDWELEDFYNRIPNIEAEIQATGDTIVPFGLRYFAVWDVDPNRGVAGNHSAYAYPYLLNGQHYNPYTKKVVSYTYRNAEDYDQAQHNSGTYSYTEWTHNLDGSGFTLVIHPPTRPFQDSIGGLEGLVQVGGFTMYSAMNDFFAYAGCNVTALWPDGTKVPRTHYVDGWIQGGSVVVPSLIPATILAKYADGYNPVGAHMSINGTIIKRRDSQFLYASGGGLGDVDDPGTFVRKYKIVNDQGPGNGPQRNAAATFLLPSLSPPNNVVPGFGVDITEGSEGDTSIYVMATVNFQNDPVFYKLDQNLNIIYRFRNNIGHPSRDGTMINATTPFDYTPGYRTFAVYKDYLIVQSNTGGGVYLNLGIFLYKMNYVTGFIEYIGSLTLAHSNYLLPTPVIYLGDGYCAIRDGVIDLGGRDGGDVTLRYVVEQTSKACGFNINTEIDAVELTDIVRGYTISRQMTGRAAIEHLQPAYQFDAVESDNKVKFKKRLGTPILTIPDSDLGAEPGGSKTAPLLTYTRAKEEDLASFVSVDYFNTNTDYQPGVQHAQRQATRSQLKQTIQFAVAFSNAEAAQIANALMYASWLEREKIEFSTTRKYAYLEPTDIVTVHNRTVRLVDRDESAGQYIKWTAVGTRADVWLPAVVPSDTPGFVPQTVPIIQPTNLLMLDIPLPTDDSLNNGAPIAMIGSVSAKFAGASLFKSNDDGATYTDTTIRGASADVVGFALTVLGSFDGGNVFDETNTVSVYLNTGSSAGLVSASAAAVLNGSNLAMLGSELIQYKNAVLTATQTYTLSGLLRGRRGTEWAMGQHSAFGGASSVYDTFVLLPTQTSYPVPIAEVGTTKQFKAVTSRQSLTAAVAVSFADTGVALLPYSCVQLGGGPNGAGDVTCNWLRRTRVGGAWRDFVEVTLSEAAEQYVIQFWDSSYTLCAQYFIFPTTSFVWSAGAQTAFFGSLQKDIFWTVGQLGSVALGSQVRCSTPGLGASNTNPTTPIAPYSFPITVAPPPVATRTPDYIFASNLQEQVRLPNFVTGQTWSGRFTTHAGTPQGLISLAEFVGPPQVHHCWISTDSGGLNKVAKSEGYGISTGSPVGAASLGAVLAGSTTYYFFFDFLQANGTYTYPVGGPGGSVVNINLT